jgi:hypothetical protein
VSIASADARAPARLPAESVCHREHVRAVAERQHGRRVLVGSVAARRAAAEHRHLATRERVRRHLFHLAIDDADTRSRFRHRNDPDAYDA